MVLLLPQLVKKFRVLCGTRIFKFLDDPTVGSCPEPEKISPYFHIHFNMKSHLLSVLSSGFFHSRLLTKMSYAFLVSPMPSAHPSYSSKPTLSDQSNDVW